MYADYFFNAPKAVAESLHKFKKLVSKAGK